MKVTLIMVTSLDGRSTEGDNSGAYTWASPEDQALFNAQLVAHDRIVMGSKTYETARSIIKLNPRHPRIVMTHTPQNFASEQQPGLLTFTANSPETVVAEAKADGCRSLLLVGGAETNARFLDAGLVDELLVTTEPLLFGSGKPFVDTLQRTIALKLASHKQLNSQGTLFTHYIIQKETRSTTL